MFLLGKFKDRFVGCILHVVIADMDRIMASLAQ